MGFKKVSIRIGKHAVFKLSLPNPWEDSHIRLYFLWLFTHNRFTRLYTKRHRGKPLRGSAKKMIQEVIRAIVQRVLRDKILMGLVIVGVLGIFLAGSNDESAHSKNTEEKLPESAMMPPAGGEAAQGQAPHKPGQNQAQPQQPAPPPQVALEPTKAADFVKWWLGGAMDFQATTATKNHEQAFLWMLPDAKESFKQAFWNDAMAEGISSGRLVAAFQPVSIEPQAINPDGTVVVSMKGSLVLQMNGQPANTSQVVTDFLVKNENDNLRIAAISNRTYVQAQAAPTYSMAPTNYSPTY